MFQNLSFSVLECWRLDEVLGLQTSWKNSSCRQSSSASTGTPVSGGEPPLQLTLRETRLLCTEDRFHMTAEKREISLCKRTRFYYCLERYEKESQLKQNSPGKNSPKRYIKENMGVWWCKFNILFSITAVSEVWLVCWVSFWWQKKSMLLEGCRTDGSGRYSKEGWLAGEELLGRATMATNWSDRRIVSNHQVETYV